MTWKRAFVLLMLFLLVACRRPAHRQASLQSPELTTSPPVLDGMTDNRLMFRTLLLEQSIRLAERAWMRWTATPPNEQRVR